MAVWTLGGLVQSQTTRLQLVTENLWMVRDMQYPVASFTALLAVFSDVLSSGGYGNNLWGTFMTWDWSEWPLCFSIYIFCTGLRLLRLWIACMYVFLYVCGNVWWWCYYWSDWGWGWGGGAVTVCGGCAGWRTGRVRGQDLSQRSGC